MEKSLYLLLFLLGIAQMTEAQVSFSASPKTVIAIKPASNFVFYNYAQFENLTNDTLPMRWVKTQITSNDGSGHGGINGLLEAWEIAIQDPVNYYADAINLDSADFYLPPVTNSTDKFIVQLFPDFTVGQLVAKYKFFPIDTPTDTMVVTFNYTATEPTTATAELNQETIRVFPNPTQGKTKVIFPEFLIDTTIVLELINLTGEVVWQGTSQMDAIEVDWSHLPKGTYFLTISQKEFVLIRQVVLTP